MPLGGSGPTVVHVGVSSLHVTEMDLPSGAFEAILWMKLVWYDRRLRWDPAQRNASLSIAASSIWVPNIFIENQQTPNLETGIYTAPAEVTPDGQITMAYRITSIFTCAMDISPYPFDMYDCDLVVSTTAGQEQVTLKDDLPFTLSGAPAGYVVDKSIRINATDSDSSSNNELRFAITVTRDPEDVFSTYVRLVWITNIIGFTQFWIPIEEGAGLDRSGVALTGMLTAAFISLEAKVSSKTTWLESYLTIATVFHILAFAATIVVSRQNRFGKLGALDLLEEGDEAMRQKAATVTSFTPTAAMNFLWGDEFDPMVDRIGRRVLVPAFFGSGFLLCFLTDSRHPSSGTNNSLFTLNLWTVVVYALIHVVWLVDIVYKKRMLTNEALSSVSTTVSTTSVDNKCRQQV